MKKEKRIEVWNKYSKRCAYCGDAIEYKDMQVDHIIPQYRYSEEHGCLIDKGKKVEYGMDDLINLNPACRVCNKWKSTWDIDEFREEIQEQLNRLQLRSSNFRIAVKYRLVKLFPKKVVFYFERIENQPNNGNYVY